MRCSLCISYVGKTTFSILRHIHYCIHGHYAQCKTFVKSHSVSCLIFMFLLFQVSQSFFSRTSLVIQLTPGHARKGTVTLALQQLTMTTSVTKTSMEIRAAHNCAQPENIMKLFEHLNETSTVLWPHCVLLVTLVKNL